MVEIGIRALKQNASKVVADVAAGEVVTITLRGRPGGQDDRHRVVARGRTRCLGPGSSGSGGYQRLAGATGRAPPLGGTGGHAGRGAILTVAHYLDTSALVKLIVREPESHALRLWLAAEDRGPVSCDLARTELMRTVRRAAPELAPDAKQVLDTVTLTQVTTAVFEQAGRLEPVTLRSLDAIHLAAALDMGDRPPAASSPTTECWPAQPAHAA